MDGVTLYEYDFSLFFFDVGPIFILKVPFILPRVGPTKVWTRVSFLKKCRIVKVEKFYKKIKLLRISEKNSFKALPKKIY